MQFVVPQFIEVETKIIGPISVRQFLILLGTAGVIFIWYTLFSTVFFLILAVITFAVGGTFAFARVNSQPFHEFALSLVQTAKRPSLAIWQREIKRQVVIKMARKDRKKEKAEGPPLQKPEVTPSHITELSLIADTRGKYSPEDLERLRKEQEARVVTPPPLELSNEK